MARMATNENTHVDALIHRLDAGEDLPGITDLRVRSYELLHLAPGAPVVDVGCGTGRAVAELNERGAKAIGVDVSERMRTVALERFPGADIRPADACDLPFDDGQLAGYRADKVYHDLPDPVRAAAEARRVLARGGRIVLIDQDWDAFIIDSADPVLTRAIVHARADALPSPRVARRLRGLLLDTGFADVTVEVRTEVFTSAAMLPLLDRLAEVAAGAVTAEQADAWHADQAERARADRLFVALPMFVAAARVP
jgi:SAM-dependent methyltransferase